MTDFRNAWSDIKTGKNIGTYILIISALFLSVANIFIESVLKLYVGPITLALLAIVLCEKISAKHKLECLDDKINHLFRSDQSILKAGIETTSSKQKNSLIDERFELAKNKIILLGTWIPGMNPLFDGMINATKRGVDVKILLLKPKSETAMQRARDLQWDTIKPFEAYKDLKWCIERNGLEKFKNFQVKFYDAIPPFRVYSADSKMLLRFYWHPDGSSTGPHIDINIDSGYLGQYVTRTFETLWNSPNTVTIEGMDKELNLQEESTETKDRL